MKLAIALFVGIASQTASANAFDFTFNDCKVSSYTYKTDLAEKKISKVNIVCFQSKNKTADCMFKINDVTVTKTLNTVIDSATKEFAFVDAPNFGADVIKFDTKSNKAIYVSRFVAQDTMGSLLCKGTYKLLPGAKKTIDSAN